MFDHLILLTILINCITMALNPPLEALERETELPFVCIFTIEMVLKLVALGFIFEVLRHATHRPATHRTDWQRSPIHRRRAMTPLHSVVRICALRGIGWISSLLSPGS